MLCAHIFEMTMLCARIFEMTMLCARIFEMTMLCARIFEMTMLCARRGMCDKIKEEYSRLSLALKKNFSVTVISLCVKISIVIVYDKLFKYALYWLC